MIRFHVPKKIAKPAVFLCYAVATMLGCAFVLWLGANILELFK